MKKITLLILAATCLNATAQRPGEKTSENTSQLKPILERRPEANLNKDNVLTLDELREARKKQTPTQKQRPTRPR